MKNRQTVILADVDGVLANWDRAAIEATGIPLIEDQITTWDWYRPFMNATEFWKRIDAHKYFWEDIDPLPHAHKVFEVMKQFGHVVFCTAPSLNPECAAEKITWLRKHEFLSKTGMNFMIGPHKWLLASQNHILVDDSTDQVDRFKRAGGQAVLFPSNTNRATFIGHPTAFSDKAEYLSQQLSFLVADSYAMFNVPLERSR